MSSPYSQDVLFYGAGYTILKNLKKELQKNLGGDAYIVSFQNTYRNHNTTRKLGIYLGGLIGMLIVDFEIVPTNLGVNETKAFYSVITLPTGIKYNRENKKRLTLEGLNKKHNSNIDNDDIADVYLLKSYVESIAT